MRFLHYRCRGENWRTCGTIRYSRIHKSASGTDEGDATWCVPGVQLKARSRADRNVARKYLAAVSEAGKIYRYIEKRKGTGQFIPEISMDETDLPQTPIELLVILAAVADEKIPIQTIAPKFTGRFNKGVDFRGDVEAFTREFSADLAVVAHAIRNYDLPDNLKLSIHSGSDKFSLYAHDPARRSEGWRGSSFEDRRNNMVGGACRPGARWWRRVEIAKEIYAQALCTDEGTLQALCCGH